MLLINMYFFKFIWLSHFDYKLINITKPKATRIIKRMKKFSATLISSKYAF